MAEPTDAQIEIEEYLLQQRDPWHEVQEPADRCTCAPCESPARGAPGIDHCAACCYGSLIEDYDHNCPEPEHRRMAELQHPSHLLIPIEEG